MDGVHRRSKPAPECLLVVKTTRGEVIGAYLTQWPRTLEKRNIKVTGGSLYLGTGESFAFAFPDGAEPLKASWREGAPDHFLYCTQQVLSVGDSALHLDQYLERVTSRSSRTFNTSCGLLWKHVGATGRTQREWGGRMADRKIVEDDACQVSSESGVLSSDCEEQGSGHGRKVSLDMTRGDELPSTIISLAVGNDRGNALSAKGDNRLSSLELSRNITPPMGLRKRGSIIVSPPHRATAPGAFWEDGDPAGPDVAVEPDSSEVASVKSATASWEAVVGLLRDGVAGRDVEGSAPVEAGPPSPGIDGCGSPLGHHGVNGDVESEIERAFGALESGRAGHMTVVKSRRQLDKPLENLWGEQGGLANERSGVDEASGRQAPVPTEAWQRLQDQQGKRRTNRESGQRRCRSLEMERPLGDQELEVAVRFSFCEGEERRWELTDGNEFDILSLQLLRFE